MKLNKIDIIDIDIDISYNIIIHDDNLNKFIYKHLLNRYNMIFNRYIDLNEINNIRKSFSEDDNYFNKLNKRFINNKYYIYNKILLYDYKSDLFIYYYIFIKKYIYKKFTIGSFGDKLNILDLSLSSDLLESCLFSYYNDNIKNIFYYRLKNYNDDILNQIIDIYKDLKSYEINNNKLDCDKIIDYYKNKKINLCNIYDDNNIYNHYINIYICLNILDENGMMILTLNKNNEKYSKSILYILNSLFDIKYNKLFLQDNITIMLYNYDKNRYLKYYNNIFKDIINKINNKITKIFNINIDNKYNNIFHNNKINKFKEHYKFDELLKLIQLSYDKNYIYNVNLCKKYDLEIRPNIIQKYNNIISKLTQQLYSMNNDEIYIITNIEKNNNIIIKFNKNNNIHKYMINIEDISKQLKMTKFYLDSRNFDKWTKIEYIINIRRSIIKYLEKEYNIRNSRGFIKMYDILNLINIIDFNKKQINTLHVCEAPGNFINSINYFIKSHNKNMPQVPPVIFNWFANSIYSKDHNYLGDEYGFVSKYPDRWDRLNDGTGDITKLDNILYIKDKYKDIDFYTSDCGIEYKTIQEMLDQENRMILINYSQILIGLLVNKIGGHMLIKLFLPISRPLSLSLIFLLYQHYEKLYFIRSSGGSQVSSEFYIIGFNKLYHLTNNNIDELLKIYNDKKIDSNYSFYDYIPEYFINKLNEITENFIKTQIKSLKRTFIYFDNKFLLDQHKNDIDKAKQIYCKEWINKNNFIILDKSLML